MQSVEKTWFERSEQEQMAMPDEGIDDVAMQEK